MAKKKTTAKRSSTKPVKKVKKTSSKKQSPVKMPDFKGIWKSIKKVNWEPILKTLGLTLIILGSFIGVDLLIQYLNNDYSVAVVNGERVSKKEYYKLLDQAYGQSISETLIEYALIRQEAEKEGIEISQEDIDAELEETISYVGGEEAFEQLLIDNGITEKDVVEQIELSLLTTKVLEPTLEYTDDDLKAFFEEYSELIFPEESANLEEGELLEFDTYKEETEDVYVNQKVEEGKSGWLQNLKAESKIQNNAVEKPKYGLLTVTRNIISNLIDNVNSNDTEE
jgi:hypothetical protein